MPGLLACLIVALACPGAARADTVANLYGDVVAVEGVDYDSRLAAYQLALSRVLVRVIGQRDTAADPLLAPLIADANRLVLRYQFLDDGRLQVSFDGPAIERRVTALGFPVWGRERPRTLIWLAMDNGLGARTLAGGEQATEAVRFLQTLSEERGIPVIFPLLDGDDLASVRFADVWGGFDDTILRASQRYAPDAVLVGRASRLPDGNWVARWTLHFAGQVYGFQGSIDEGLQLTADLFARQFAVLSAGSDGSIRMLVSQVNGVADYAELRGYLEQLSLVSSVYVSQAAGTGITFDIQLRGGAQQLRRALALNPRLVEDPSAPLAREGVLYYQFRP